MEGGLLVSASDVAHELETLYRDLAYHRRLAHTAYFRATDARYFWQRLGHELTTILRSVC